MSDHREILLSVDSPAGFVATAALLVARALAAGEKDDAQVPAGEDVDAAAARVDAIRQCEVDDAVQPTEGDGRLRPIAGERLKPVSPATGQDQGQDIAHGVTVSNGRPVNDGSVNIQPRRRDLGGGMAG